jgi:hypothetical protein
MEIKSTNVFKWLKSEQIKFIEGDDTDTETRTIVNQGIIRTYEEYVPRMEKTRKKINKLIQSVRYLPNDEETIKELTELRDSIGPWMIMPETESIGLWFRYNFEVKAFTGGDISVYDFKELDNIWYDFLGEPTTIRERGGYVLVMLSDEGIVYLNELQDKLSK